MSDPKKLKIVARKGNPPEFTAQTVEMNCGHVVKVSLYGTPDDQREELKRLAGAFCKECWISRKNQRDEIDAADVERDRPYLPVLTGSPKQVRWARNTRAKAIPLIEEVIAEAVYELSQLAAKDPANDQVSAAEFHLNWGSAVSAESEAGFWIQNRSHFADKDAVRGYMNAYVYQELVKEAIAKRSRA